MLVFQSGLSSAPPVEPVYPPGCSAARPREDAALRREPPRGLDTTLTGAAAPLSRLRQLRSRASSSCGADAWPSPVCGLRSRLIRSLLVVVPQAGRVEVQPVAVPLCFP